ncbi:MAG: hypothetical protein KF687_02355 [Cyclobacteriaceae bacterium]|nr:hypothetical protein [Cyclobacteriaceae bacterium]
MKKGKNKKKELKEKGAVLAPLKKQAAQESENDNPFDFGGLPQRDLKKNLGCG